MQWHPRKLRRQVEDVWRTIGCWKIGASTASTDDVVGVLLARIARLEAEAARRAVVCDVCARFLGANEAGWMYQHGDPICLDCLAWAIETDGLSPDLPTMAGHFARTGEYKDQTGRYEWFCKRVPGLAAMIREVLP